MEGVPAVVLSMLVDIKQVIPTCPPLVIKKLNLEKTIRLS